jgi:hypothetical protein
MARRAIFKRRASPSSGQISHCFQNDDRQMNRLLQFAAKADWREAEQQRSMTVQTQC